MIILPTQVDILMDQNSHFRPFIERREELLEEFLLCGEENSICPTNNCGDEQIYLYPLIISGVEQELISKFPITKSILDQFPENSHIVDAAISDVGINVFNAHHTELYPYDSGLRHYHIPLRTNSNCKLEIDVVMHNGEIVPMPEHQTFEWKEVDVYEWNGTRTDHLTTFNPREGGRRTILMINVVENDSLTVEEKNNLVSEVNDQIFSSCINRSK